MRAGHTRPEGTLWRTRMRDCHTEPQLGDLLYESPEELRRGYRIVGVEETRKATTFGLVLERMKWGEFLEAVTAVEDDRVWSFTRDRR